MTGTPLDDLIDGSIPVREVSTVGTLSEPSPGTSPILVCRGPHLGTCPLLERNGINGLVGDHGFVVELDFDIPDHRAFLGTLRAAISDETALVIFARVDPGCMCRRLSGPPVWTSTNGTAWTQVDDGGFAETASSR